MKSDNRQEAKMTNIMEHPKVNAERERFMRTIKEHLFWTREYDNVFEFEEAFEKFILFYNEEYPSSKLKYQSPNHFYRTYSRKTGCLFLSAGSN